MAAVDEEDSQSENNNDEPHDKTKGKPFSTMHQEIENKLVKPGTSYEDRVGIVLSGWDHLAGAAPTGQITFAKFLYKWTLQLVLQGEWPKLEKIVKTRLKATLQRCTRDEMMQSMCNTLLPLVTDPWGHSTLKAIIAGSYVSDEEAEQYIREETWPVVKVRVNTLADSRCVEMALSLLKVCMRCIRIKSDLKETLLNSQEDHNHFVDLYFVLMYKYQKKQLVEEIKRLDLLEGVDHIRRLLAQQEKSKVWKSRLKVAELEIQVILASCIVKPFESSFANVFCVWCSVMKEINTNSNDLADMVRKYIPLAEESQHIYCMGSTLHNEFGETHAALVTELLIRALTTDMNALEGAKLNSKDGSREEQKRLEHQMAEGFMNLSIVFSQHDSIARECVLTAFSLHPTPNRLEKLKCYGLLTNDKEEISEEPEIEEQPNSCDKGHPSPISKENVLSPPPPPPPSKPLVNKDNENLRPLNYSSPGGSSSSANECGVEVLDTGQRSFDIKPPVSYASYTFSNLPISTDMNHPSRGQTEKPIETQDIVISHNSDNVNEPAGAVGSEHLDYRSKIQSCTRTGRDIWEAVDEGGFCNNSHIENKVKEDVDSMDGFLGSTEGLIEQLSEKEIKTEPQEKKPDLKDIDPPNFDILTDPQAVLNEEKLGLSKELCDDLAVVLSSPRYQVLSWMLERSKLLAICETYMKEDSDKNVTKELKFLNLDYSQFQHLPSAEVDEFTGIEKGYEHFIENTSDIEEEEDYYYAGMHNYYSSGSELDGSKRNRSTNYNKRGRKGRPPFKKKYLNSDSDSAGRSKSRSRVATSVSESEDSEFDSMGSVVDNKDDKEFEGKRVTAISSNDRRKRLRIDATTGRVKSSHGKSSVNHLRLYRHQSPFLASTRSSFVAPNSSTSTSRPYNNNNNNGCASLPAPLNVNSNVVLNHYDRSSIDNRVQDPLENGVTSETVIKASSGGRTEGSSAAQTNTESKPTPFQKNPHNGNWRYAGYVVSKPQNNESKMASSIPTSQSETVKCSYRTREGRLVTLNTRSYIEENRSHNVEYFRKLSSPSSKFEESFAKFLMQQKSNIKDKNSAGVTLNKKAFPLERSFEYLKRQGTSVIFKKNNSTNALATAQKNVLDQIMSPENSRHTIIGRSSNEQLPIRAIAMPVSHNPPNLPPPDKNNPTGLSRVLPKGTTVVRRPKTDAGAGPSGLNNGGPTAVISRSPIVRSLPNQPRPAISITPSSHFLGSGTVTSYTNNLPVRNNVNQTSLASTFNPLEGPSTSATFPGSVSSQNETENFSPLASATVVGSVSQTLSPRLNSNNSPGETQGSCFVSLNSNRNVTFSSLNQATSCTTTTAVATITGEPRAPSMLESLLRDRSTPSSPLVMPLQNSESSPLTTTSSSITDLNVASSPTVTGSSVPTSSLSEALNLVTNPTSINSSNSDSSLSLPGTANAGVPNLGDSSISGNMSSNLNLGVSSIPVVGSNLPTTVLPPSLPASVISSGVATPVNVSTGSTTNTVEPQAAGMHQLLLPAQLIQVQGSDGSTGLGIVHSGSLDLRLPPGTRVIKSSTSNMRPTTPVAISQTPSRPLNVLHNVKIVQNRQIVRTVVVPHSMALQGLGGQQTAQIVALNQNPGTSNNGIETQIASKISSSQLQKMLGHNIVPGGLVIRAVRPQTSEGTSEEIVKPPGGSSIIQHTSEIQPPEKEKVEEKAKVVPLQATDEGLAERLNRHYLKTALLTSTSTQSVGTQTQTTAVKPVTGQLVNQVVMNHLRGISGNPAVSSVPVVTNSVPSSGLSPLSLSSSNAVSSETLEQLREFESVFEKVSNKSVKENETTKATSQPSFPPANISSEESMIAAQLLSMANDTPSVTSASSYVYTIPTTTDSGIVTLSSSTATASISSSTVSGTRLGEGTFITIPSSTQGGGTLILVNPSAATSGSMTMTSSAQTTQPPPAASPALSSTSSHSSVASSPSSTSSKNKSKGSKPKVTTPPSAPVTPTKPKSPPPPKAPPKPTVAKPQVEESDETRARIQAILDQYKQDLANTPQPQPAPRNRKNCPPPKNEGKSSSKKKSQVKKPDGTSSTSPCASESGNLPSVSPSPAPLAVTPSGEDSEGSIGGTSISGSNFHSQDDKKSEDGVPSQVLQGVVVSNVKVDNSGLGNSLSTIPQGRVVQLIRHGSKVTAITTKQPYQKAKAGLSSGGPPPNVTIQGRINMNDLMESHLASLLAGGSATINQSSALITKLIQAQQQQNPVQQVVVQTSGGGMGQQVIQQVSLQPVIATHNKTQHIQNQVISGIGVNVADNSNQPSNSPIKNALRPQPSPVMSVGVSPSPGTPQQRVSSPSTPSPAPELPSTPSSFPTAGEESNTSEESNDGTAAAPLPPFFTLTKQFMTPQQSQQFSNKVNESTSQISLSPTTDSLKSKSKVTSERSANNSTTVTIVTSQPPRSSFIRSSFSKNVNVNCPSAQVNKSSVSGSIMLAHSAPPSPLVSAPGENVLEMSPVSGPSSLESSPSVLSHRLPLVTTSELRSNSLDSVKSDLSVEEVQIPPSPATLTKQLQNAYMTEAALSPTVSHSHLSSSSNYSSPTTVQGLQSTEPRVIFPNLGHSSHTYSLAGQSSSASSLSNTSNGSVTHNNPSMENNTLTCLSSPSGDVYLDQAGVGLGLDSLPLVEGRPQSPSLSDLVPAVPLLSWSPRSADSIMGQSPSLNEALTGNMTLDVHHSEDSLCDSSTGFPGLFAMDGDGASASSTNSDDILNSSNPCLPISSASTTAAVFSVAPSQVLSRTDHLTAAPHNSFGKRLPNHEQDHTISSTRSESLGTHLGSLEITQPGPGSDDADLLKQDESTSSTIQEGDTWKFETLSKTNSNVGIDLSDENTSGSHNDGKSDTGSQDMNVQSPSFLSKKNHQQSSSDHQSSKVKEDRDSIFVRSKLNNEMVNSKPLIMKDENEIVHNGFEIVGDLKEDEEIRDKEDDKSSIRNKQINAEGSHEACKTNSVKEDLDNEAEENYMGCEKLSKSLEIKRELKDEEDNGRQTRGSKRRSDSDFVQEEKRSRSSRSRKSENNSDISPDEEKPPSIILDDGNGGVHLTRSLRSRNISGTSDSSSNYSLDRVSTPGPQDSPAESGNGSSRRRKRRGSHDSSVSSRDSSPLTVLLNSQQQEGNGTSSKAMHTRRSSSRDHAKKTRCRCCVDQSSTGGGGGGGGGSSSSSSSGGGGMSGRRASGRVSRGSGPHSSSNS